MIAGGGTGGHVFPGIALAEAFLRLSPGGEVSFVGTEGGFEARAVPARGHRIDFVPSGQVRGRGLSALAGLFRMAVGTCRAFSLLGRLRPALVFGVGGYASVPVALAAAVRGVPLFLQEQNSVPGRSNRILSRLARKVYCGFEGALPYFPPGKAVLSGNPVRREVEAAAAGAEAAGPGGILTVLALGGSQGARAINRLVLDAAARAKEEGLPVRFLLQSGERELAAVEAEVREKGLPVSPFAFSQEVSALFLSAHAVVMRAGALSISEASLFGRPCFLVPYPHAADRHQERNAEELARTGGASWLPEGTASPEALLRFLAEAAADGAAREEAGRRLRAFGRPGAAERIVSDAMVSAGVGAGGA